MSKKGILLVALLAFFSSVTSSMAVTPTEKGPDVVKLKMGTNTIPFQHKMHQIKLNNECYHCHKTKNGKIDNWGKESAHIICIACHDLYDNGQVECKGCHTK